MKNLSFPILGTSAFLSLVYGLATSVVHAVAINFEELGPRPSTFLGTVALTNEYADLDLVFSGTAPGNGGGILDQDGSFGLNARSGRNFLAFNSDAKFSNGGIPNFPQTISFLSGASSLWLGSGQINGFSLTAYAAFNNIVDMANVSNTPGNFAQLSVSGQHVQGHFYFHKQPGPGR